MLHELQEGGLLIGAAVTQEELIDKLLELTCCAASAATKLAAATSDGGQLLHGRLQQAVGRSLIRRRPPRQQTPSTSGFPSPSTCSALLATRCAPLSCCSAEYLSHYLREDLQQPANPANFLGR